MPASKSSTSPMSPHNVRRYTLEKPADYSFKPGQATEVSLDEDGWRDKKHPFTFTVADRRPEPRIHHQELLQHRRRRRHRAALRLQTRPVAGAARRLGHHHLQRPGHLHRRRRGVTPFIAILRDLHHNRKMEGHTLIVSNRTEADIILRDEFESFRGLETIWTVTDDAAVEPAARPHRRQVPQDPHQGLRPELLPLRPRRHGQAAARHAQGTGRSKSRT